METTGTGDRPGDCGRLRAEKQSITWYHCYRPLRPPTKWMYGVAMPARPVFQSYAFEQIRKTIFSICSVKFSSYAARVPFPISLSCAKKTRLLIFGFLRNR
jgi:hypothetical protein